jgi:PAS domain S-box-containing protein
MADTPTYEEFQERIKALEKAEAALKENEKKYKQTSVMFETLFNTIPDVIGVQDTKHGVIRYNNAGYQFLQVTHEEVEGKKCFELIGRDSVCTDCASSECYKTKAPAQVEKYVEEMGVWLDCRAYPVLDDEGNITGVIEHLRDISEQKKAENEKRKLENQLQQAYKMEAIYTMAGGIAHDFNNILGVILGNAEIAMEDLPDEEQVRHSLQEIKKVCLRAKALIKGILAFSRQDKQDLKPIRITSIVKESVKFLRSSIPSTIEIRQDISDVSFPILSNPVQVNQVMMNLCANAFHAMRDKGGVLSITLKEIVIEKDRGARLRDLAPGEYLQLTVRDTGCGMDPNLQERIFHPYFTTKSAGEGTGMGLAMVHGIMQNHGGKILVSSEVNKGSVFDVYFPRVKKAETDDRHLVPESMPTGSERILLIDDEEQVLGVAEQILKHLGYDVTAFQSSTEALSVFRSDPDQFDLVITDTTMPGMTGVELSEALMAVRGDLPIILCTGYSEKVSQEKADALGVKGLLMKPITKREMATMVRQALDPI